MDTLPPHPQPLSPGGERGFQRPAICGQSSDRLDDNRLGTTDRRTRRRRYTGRASHSRPRRPRAPTADSRTRHCNRRPPIAGSVRSPSPAPERNRLPPRRTARPASDRCRTATPPAGTDRRSAAFGRDRPSPAAGRRQTTGRCAGWRPASAIAPAAAPAGSGTCGRSNVTCEGPARDAACCPGHGTLPRPAPCRACASAPSCRADRDSRRRRSRS